MNSRLLPALAALPLLIVVGCLLFVPPAEPTPRPTVPEGVSTLQLARAPENYSGRSVRCLLFARDFTCADEGLLWGDGAPFLPPVLFVCPIPESRDTEPLQIDGICRGLVNGRVVVTDCTVSSITRRLP